MDSASPLKQKNFYSNNPLRPKKMYLAKNNQFFKYLPKQIFFNEKKKNYYTYFKITNFSSKEISTQNFLLPKEKLCYAYPKIINF